MRLYSRVPIHFIISLAWILGVIGVSPGALTPSQVNASVNHFYLPAVFKPAVVTPFGAFLDASGIPDQGLAKMAAAGSSWVHVPISWSQVQTSQLSSYDWGMALSSENVMKAAANNGMSTILYLSNTPDWAVKTGLKNCGPVAQDKFPDLVNFLTNLVRRYSALPYNVKYYELWSEPDVAGSLGCWGDPSDLNYFGGGYYGEMLKVAYPAIKRANPYAQVLIGGLLMDCNPVHVEYCSGNPASNQQVANFLKGALVDGAGPYFDGVSYHAYDYYWGLGNYSNPNWGSAWNTTGPVSLAKAAYLRSLLAQYDLTGKYLMNTEAALICGSSGLEDNCISSDHTATVSEYITQVYTTGIADGANSIIWFSTGGWRGSQLLTSDQGLLPTYNAYAAARFWLGEAAYNGEITRYASIKGFQFSKGGSRIWVLWSVAGPGQSFNIDLGQAPTAVYDMYGNLIPSAANPLNIGQNPVYVVFKP